MNTKTMRLNIFYGLSGVWQQFIEQGIIIMARIKAHRVTVSSPMSDSNYLNRNQFGCLHFILFVTLTSLWPHFRVHGLAFCLKYQRGLEEVSLCVWPVPTAPGWSWHSHSLHRQCTHLPSLEPRQKLPSETPSGTGQNHSHPAKI